MKIFESFFYKQSVGHKLIILILGTCGISLFATSIFLLFFTVDVFKDKHLDRVEAIAGVIGLQSEAAIEFFDEETAYENLEHAFSDNAIILACLYNDKNELF